MLDVCLSPSPYASEAMANTKKDVVHIIDTAGREFSSRRTWAQKHVDAERAYWINGSLCRFYTADQLAERRAGALSRRLHRAQFKITFRSAELDPSTGTAPFLPYPQPSRAGRSESLATRYPGLANCHA
jgi:hypothetical protein